MIPFSVDFRLPAGSVSEKAGVGYSFYPKGKIYIAPLAVVRYAVFRGWRHVAPRCEVTA